MIMYGVILIIISIVGGLVLFFIYENKSIDAADSDLTGLYLLYHSRTELIFQAAIVGLILGILLIIVGWIT